MSIDWMNQDRKKIVNFLEGLLPEGLGKIKDAARYSAVNSKAHFWRPLLAFASGKAYGVESDKILPYSLTPELFHTASLIMDDLPSMDDADFRRGKPSCHKKFDIATTDLCFYYLIEKARTIIQDSDLPNESKMKILKISTETSFQLIEGQKRDLYGVAADKDLVFDEVISLYQQKTGAMFAYAISIGGILGNASEDELKELHNLGESIGIAYQIKDDILDVCGDEKEIGKPIHQDENKTTVIDLIGIDKSRELIEDYKLQIKKIISSLEEKDKDVSYFNDFVSEMLEIK